MSGINEIFDCIMYPRHIIYSIEPSLCQYDVNFTVRRNNGFENMTAMIKLQGFRAAQTPYRKELHSQC